MSERKHVMLAPLEPETRIGGYELVRRIGVGGMAEVWVARRVSERKANKYVAIKVVADHHVGDPRFQRMFKTEVELSALLNHVNIVQVFDEGEDVGRSYLVMEWIDGVNLLKIEAALTFIDDEPWRLKVIMYVVGQLLYALHYAHSITHEGSPLGIVHRDVSPQNVLVSAQGEVKLTDFGVAHYLLEESSGTHVKGKLRYMSPEQLAGKTRDPRLDLFAVGAILHELLDGRRFRHDVEDQRDMYIEVISGQIPKLSRPAPPELDALRLGLLEPDLARRIPSADAALERLSRIPGYGDARRELTQLCGGLTGVLRPRVGPGMVTAAAPAVESVPVPAVAAVPAAPLAEATVAPASMGQPAASNESAGVEATQPWVRGAISGAVPTSASAPIQTSSHGVTDSAAPAAATMLMVRRRESAVAARTSRAPWALVGVAAMALLGGGAWWTLDGRARFGAAAEGREVASHAAPTGEASVLPERTYDGATGAAPKGAGDVHAGVETSAATDATGTAGETGGAGTTEEPSTSGSASETGDGSGTGDASEAGEPSETATMGSKPPPPRPKQALSLVAVAALGPVKVEVRSKDRSIRKRYDLDGRSMGTRLPIGSYLVKWRKAAASQWSPSQRIELRRGCDLRVVIEAKGMTPVFMGSACR